MADDHHAALPQLSKPQATVLALGSLGMVLARSCALTAVSALVAAVEGRQENTMRQRLRAWYYEAPAKQGTRRQALQVETCFAPLLGWIVRGWQGTQLAVALEATTLGARFVVLAISVVSRGWAIPVAWVILPANPKHPWRGEWLRLWLRLWRVVPRHWTVIVLAARGLQAPWLFRRLVTWLILTALAPEASDAGWYGLRTWIEQGCKLTKRAGWQWHRTRRTDPVRAARLGLAVAVATLWVVSIGGGADATIPAGPLPDVTELCPAQRRPRRATQWRLVSVFRRGWLMLMGARLRHDPVPESRFLPEPWPAIQCLREDSPAEDTPLLPRAA